MKTLLIEDDDMDAEALARSLRRIDRLTFEVDRCDRLSTSLEMLVNGRYELLLVDLGLPDSDGIDTVARLVQAAPQSAIIVQTGFDSESSAMEMVEAGAQDYLIKGRFDSDSLLRAIRYAVSRKHSENRLREVNAQLADALNQLKSAQSDLVRSERMRAIGQMSCGIAHDFNNALTPIVTGAEYLLSSRDAMDDREVAREILGLIKTSADDAAGVVRRLRSFYQVKADQQDERVIDVGELLADVRALTEPKWKNEAQSNGEQISVAIEVIPGCFIEGDAGEMREVLMNLVFNAVDAIEGEGTITMKALRNSEHVTIEVSDDGVGMSEEMARQCFEPFVSSKGRHGTGLGLSTALGIVDKHRGTLDVRSKEGVGTSFILQLPSAAVAKSDGRAANEVQSPNSGRILLVDDEKCIRLVIKMALTREGYECSLATDGKEALEKFAPGRFDLVITDRSMPGMSGDEFSRRIREMDSDIPIVMLTGYGDLMNAADELPAGVNRIIAKPFNMPQFREVLSGLIR